MIACMCGYEAPGLTFMVMHLSWAHSWTRADVTSWMARYVTDAIREDTCEGYRPGPAVSAASQPASASTPEATTSP